MKLMMKLTKILPKIYFLFSFKYISSGLQNILAILSCKSQCKSIGADMFYKTSKM